MTDPANSDREVKIERIVDAPRNLVFKMWSEPDHFRKWAAPSGFTVDSLEMEFRVGGLYRVCLRSPEGEDWWVRGRYREIVEPERFSLTNAWENKDGSTGTETLLTVTFEDLGDQTKVTLHQAEFQSVESRDGNATGWSETLDRLPEYLATVAQSSESRTQE